MTPNPTPETPRRYNSVQELRDATEGKLCEKKCPKCGSHLLRNKLGDEWCSFVNCDFGIEDRPSDKPEAPTPPTAQGESGGGAEKRDGGFHNPHKRGGDDLITEVGEAIADPRIGATPPPCAAQSKLCDTTLTERFVNPNCKCATYEGNLGPCRTFELGASGRCVYCDHEKDCHAACAAQEGPTPLLCRCSDCGAVWTLDREPAGLNKCQCGSSAVQETRTDTPQTDLVAGSDWTPGSVELVPASLARTLERALAESKAECERLQLQLTAIGDFAVVDWDDKAVGAVDAAVPAETQIKYKDYLRALFIDIPKERDSLRADNAALRAECDRLKADKERAKRLLVPALKMFKWNTVYSDGEAKTHEKLTGQIEEFLGFEVTPFINIDAAIDAAQTQEERV